MHLINMDSLMYVLAAAEGGDGLMSKKLVMGVIVLVVVAVAVYWFRGRGK